MGDVLRTFVAIAAIGGLGATLLLSELPWFRRTSLVARLAPYGSGQRHRAQRPGTFKAALQPVANGVGGRIAKSFGVRDDLSVRLQRAGREVDATTFRLRQLAIAAGTLLVVAGLSTSAGAPPAASAFLCSASPLLAFLVMEQDVARAAVHRQRRTFFELPVVLEQLAMLIDAGYSLGAALQRLAERNAGSTGADLRRVHERTQTGLSVTAALQEWADAIDIPELRRTVAVLSLVGETNDLGRLISHEARAIRNEAQRRLLHRIDERGQQVWIPVTIATLVPGVIFLVIPFLHALSAFSAS